MATQVLAQTPREQYNATVGQTTFTYPFQIMAAADLDVWQVRSGTATLLTFATDYTLTGVGDLGGGTVELVVASVAGDKIVVVRNTNIERLSGYTTAGSVTGDNLNVDFNRFLRIGQEMQKAIQRSIRMADADTGSEAGLELPAVATRAGKLLGFDDDGDLATFEASDESATAATATGSTTSRTLAARFGDLVNVADWGVSPAASDTTNTAALLVLLAALPAGRTVFFPAGTYQFASLGIVGSGFKPPANTEFILGKAVLQLTGTSECGFFWLDGVGGFVLEGGTIEGHDVSTADGLSGSLVFVQQRASAVADIEDFRILGTNFSGARGAGWVRFLNEDATYNINGILIDGGKYSGGSDRAPTSLGTAAHQIYFNTEDTGAIQDWVVRGTRHAAGAVKTGFAAIGAELRTIRYGTLRDVVVRDAGQDTGAGVENAYGIALYDSIQHCAVKACKNIDAYTGAYMVQVEHLSITDFHATGQEETTDSTLARGGLALHGNWITARNLHFRDCQRGLAVQAGRIPASGNISIDIEGVVFEGSVIEDMRLRANSAADCRGGRIANIHTDGGSLSTTDGIRLSTGSFKWKNLKIEAPKLFNRNCIIPSNQFDGVEVSDFYFRPKAGHGWQGTGGPDTPNYFVLRDGVLDGAATTAATQFGIGMQDSSPGVIENVHCINWKAADGNGFAFQLRTAQAQLRGITFQDADQLVAATAGEDLGLDTPTWTPSVEGTFVQKLTGLSVDGSGRAHVGWQYIDGAWRTIFVSAATWA